MLKVRGYAAVFGNKDLGGDVIVKGAFSEWIAENPAKSLPLFWNHSHVFNPTAKPIGVTTKIKQDRTGLYFEGEIADTPEGLEVQELLKAGAVNGASFAFKIHDREERKGVWYLKALEPREITAANWGMNPKAYIEAIPGQENAEETDQ